MEERRPAILLPYVSIPDGCFCRDVFVYLRPETNGVEIESIIMNALREEDSDAHHVSLVYLANFPGDFISTKGLIEHHYRIRLLFALRGKKMFTSHMKKAFKAYFRCSFDRADIIGPYEAMKRLGIDEETLFKTWVKPSNMLNVNGQSIKRIQDFYVLNYDIPALLNKNNRGTDIAVMVFRTLGKNVDISFMVDAIDEKLESKGIVNVFSPASRVFHYSKGPFEELLDASGFLYSADLKNIPLTETAFGKFLTTKGVELPAMEGAIRNPIMYFRTENGGFEESDLFTCTKGFSYPDALAKLQSVFSQRVIR